MEGEKCLFYELDENGNITDKVANFDEFLDNDINKNNMSNEIDNKNIKNNDSYTYMNYLMRPTPPNKGMKIIPTGKPYCLIKKSFLITGVLDSLEKEEAIELIKSYGGLE